MAYLGIDLGTSGLRALLVDADGVPLASAERHYDIAHPHPGWSEQDPADWIDALDGAVEELRANCPEFTGLRGIGVSFVNYLEELPYFCDEVLPRLEKMGLREERG